MSPLRIVKRQEPLGWSSFLVLFTAVLLSLVLSGLILIIGGTPPLEGIVVLFKGAFGSRYAFEDALLKATPIFLCSLGVAIAFRLQ
ncbi:MAG: ABC transporter permease, partial [Desulfobacterales bacterium]|nr:ABC transporter permease [Desulfobacterales bacterium]